MNREERMSILQNRYKAYKRLPKKHKKAMNISLQILQQRRRRTP